jgi:predicted ArsR family transcriptional regulator
MFLKVARAIARPQTFAVLDLLKRSTGLSVNEIAKSLKLSYMGVKQYCTELEKKGLVDTWRRPTAMGRPEKSYRLTEKAAAFYPEVGNEMTLELLKTIAQLYGETAPDKLLFSYFNKKADGYLKKIKGSTLTERAASFAKLRDSEGCCAQIEYDEEQGYRLVEFHSPLKEIAEHFPNVLRMEELMFSKVLGLAVQRSEVKIAGLRQISFLIPLTVVPQGLVATAKVAKAPIAEVKPVKTAKAPSVKPTLAEPESEIEISIPEIADEVEPETSLSEGLDESVLASTYEAEDDASVEVASQESLPATDFAGELSPEEIAAEALEAQRILGELLESEADQEETITPMPQTLAVKEVHAVQEELFLLVG